MYDFHTHTFLSDGVLAPVELIRRSVVAGYRVIAITDHVGEGNLEFVLTTLAKDCEMANKRWDIRAVPGVELTHVPKDDIDRLASDARAMGAVVINVHGETVSEPVESGTNRAAVSSDNVDILAHPGLIDEEDASIAASSGVLLEVSTRRNHAYANGHVVRMAKNTGARMILNSDAHAPEELLSREFAMKVARGAGLSQSEAVDLLDESPKYLLKKIDRELLG